LEEEDTPHGGKMRRRRKVYSEQAMNVIRMGGQYYWGQGKMRARATNVYGQGGVRRRRRRWWWVGVSCLWIALFL
jgi:hypothetical protein